MKQGILKEDYPELQAAVEQQPQPAALTEAEKEHLANMKMSEYLAKHQPRFQVWSQHHSTPAPVELATDGSIRWINRAERRRRGMR